ncbi:MAG: 2-dehydropantoate 2-reductase [Candidatus Hydrogenedentes bacterium]|nr:2-dehydropantoate 2-reductase [Candidatus Hydrogenedentota bacterium]
MKVTVVGPGAMGCLFAARLSESGVQTTLLDHNKDRAKRLAKSGLAVESDSGILTAAPVVTTSVPNKQDLIIVLTKAHATATLELPPATPILTLQNGLGNVESLCDLVGSAFVLAGTTSEAATYLEEGRVRHAASGLTKVGAWTTCSTDGAVTALAGAGFDVEVTESPGQAIWEKVVVSAGINTISALLGVPNGQLIEHPETRKLMRDLVVEAAKVAAIEGYRFEHSLIDLAEDICLQTASNVSSMLQDIRAGRRTEIEAISGEVMRRAEMAFLPTPRTRVIYQLIKGLEAARAKSDDSSAGHDSGPALAS